MEHNILTLDFWRDTVTYEGYSMPTGTIGCEALNISDDTIEQLNTLCQPLNSILSELSKGKCDVPQLTLAAKAAVLIFEFLKDTPPFSRLDTEFYKAGILNAYTQEGLQNFQAYSIALTTGSFSLEQTEQYRAAILIAKLTPVLANLGYSLAEYKKTMCSFVEAMDADNTDRSPDGLARLFGEKFSPEFTLSSGAFWMSLANVSIQYVSSIMPKKSSRSWSSGCTMFPLWGCFGQTYLKDCVSAMRRGNAPSAAGGFLLQMQGTQSTAVGWPLGMSRAGHAGR